MASEETCRKGTEDSKSENINNESEDNSRGETDSVEQQQHNIVSTEPNVNDDNKKSKAQNEEDLLNELKGIDLNDDDTEMLLVEAYAMNQKLKEILKQQEAESENRKSSKRPGNGSRSAGSKHPVLPPIKSGQNSKQSNLYSARMPRPTQSGSPAKRTSPQNRQYSSSAQFSKDMSSARRPKPQKSARSSNDRPEWNERFSFS